LKIRTLIGCFFVLSVHGSENTINNQWCQKMNGISQFTTKDRTYVDCLTNEYAVETEYDYNWKEAVGQSLHYAETTDRKAAILLIQRSSSKKNYLSELNRVIQKFDLPIKVYVVGGD
tara:strand:- start:58 stop:408 length:351 start_codon:yes stop_codon:yes gene_type:complete